MSYQNQQMHVYKQTNVWAILSMILEHFLVNRKSRQLTIMLYVTSIEYMEAPTEKPKTLIVTSELTPGIEKGN